MPESLSEQLPSPLQLRASHHEKQLIDEGFSALKPRWILL